MLKILNAFQLILICLWTAICATLVFILTLLTLKKECTSFVGRRIWGPGLLIICRVQLIVSGTQNVDFQKKYIYASNHESLLDIPAIFTAIPVNLFFIAKKELKKVPFLGWAMQIGGMIFIDRKNKEQAKKDMMYAGELIKKGKNIISFPEGTRTKNGEMGTFKRGTFLLSMNTGIEIIPVALHGARELLPTNSFGLKPGKIYLHFLPPVSPQTFSSVEIFAEAVRQKILEEKHHTFRKEPA